MAIFRVAKTRDYTVMSNCHLRDKTLTLKAKGLLSVLLSLPENWNYTTRGLAAICKEGVDSISTTLHELENAGYLTRRRLRTQNGRISDTEYVVYESPRKKPEVDMTKEDLQDTVPPCTENPDTVSPDVETPRTDTPDTEKPVQLNTHVSSTYESNTHKSNLNLSAACTNDMEQMDAKTYWMTREQVKTQIEYDALNTPHDHERLDEIVEIMTETLCSHKPYIKVAGENYPTEVVKSRFKKLNYHHIEYVFLSLDKKHTEVRNIRQYLMTTLYHASTTMSNYYDAEVRSAGLI